MRVSVQTGGIINPPKQLENADSVLISTDEGDPIVVALSMEGNIWVKTVEDPDFAGILETIGFDKRIPVVEDVKVGA